VNKEFAHAVKKVVVVDDDADACLCLRDILSEDGGYDCVGTCTSAGDALIDIPRINPDLVLMDVHLPDINGIECTRRLCELMPFLKVIMVTGVHDENTIMRSLHAGAIGYLVKPVTPDQCRATLKYAVAATERCDSPPASAKNFPPPYNSALLTHRENLVMKCLADGLLYKEIADRLKISYSAVHKLQHKIFIKLKVANRSEAISKWRGDPKQL
jgi:DNA-binding NarL/FixJ family response regulator